MQTMTYFLLTKFEHPLQILLWALIAFVLVKIWVASRPIRTQLCAAWRKFEPNWNNVRKRFIHIIFRWAI